MKKTPHVVIYYHGRHLRVYNVFIVPAKDSTQAKREAAKLQKLKRNQVASATRMSTIKHTWHVF